MKKIFTLLLALMASTCSLFAESGTCGDNLTWELNIVDSTLTISGVGNMEDYGINKSPWYVYKDIIKTVTLSSGVTSIGCMAFCDCDNLISIHIPNTVETIEHFAFEKCSSLPTVDIPSSVTRIGKWIQNASKLRWYDPAFHSCTSLVAINVDVNNLYFTSVDGVLYDKNMQTIIQYPIGKSNLSYTIPEGVQSIYRYAFGECKNLNAIIIPNSINEVAEQAFAGCDNLNTPIYNAHLFAYLPLSYVGDYAIPDGIEIILEMSFYQRTGLTAIHIPNSVKTIEKGAFSSCFGLTSLEIPMGVTSIGSSAFNYCSKIASVQIPNSVTNIGWGAFGNCGRLATIELPNSITSLPYALFRSCYGLSSVTIPSSVTDIGDNVFEGCTNLSNVICLATTPPELGQKVFKSVDCSQIPLYVPEESIDRYRAANQWKEFNPILPVSLLSIDNFSESITKSSKILREGKVYILRGDKTFTPQGQEVR